MSLQILGTRVDSVDYDSAVQMIGQWAQEHERRYICVAAVQTIMETHDSLEYQKMVNAAALVTPDGMPLVWTLRRNGFPQQTRVYGPELTLRLLESAAENGIPVGFLGSTPETLELLVKNARRRFPTMRIDYVFSPPFRPVSKDEDELIVKEINDSGVGILLVGLGCPKQEKWMAAHAGKVNAVMVGVGAAFDFIAGTKRQSPKWMQSLGLEWLFRLSQEPARLWWRYLYHNPRFVFLVMLPALFRCSSRAKS
jgi:N-acetylglucosaminyldiphosphoundecaprenol N-acetyl-beta-D-mannosaminyltransferase